MRNHLGIFILFYVLSTMTDISPKAPGSTICVRTSPSLAISMGRRRYPTPDQKHCSYSTGTPRGYGLDIFSDGQWTRTMIQK